MSISAKSLRRYWVSVLFLFMTISSSLCFAEERQSFFDQFRESFKESYNTGVNAAHFQGVVVDAALFSRSLARYYEENQAFPATVEEIQFSVFSEHIDAEIQLEISGVFHFGLSDQFGNNKSLTMTPVLDNGRVSRWVCHSNVSVAVSQGTFCVSVN